MRLSLHPIARPELRLPIVNNPTIFLEDHRCLAAMNISDEGRDSRIFLVNVDTLESEWHQVPDHQWGPYGFVRGVDGRIYVGFFYGRIYSFDPAEKTFACVADPFAGQTVKRLTWGGGASRAGRVFMGVYPTGEFTDYDITSGQFHTVAPLEGTPFGVYANQFQELPDGRILVLLYGSHGEILIYDPATRRIDERREIVNRAWQSKIRSLCLLDEHRVIYAVDQAVKTFNFQTMDWEEDFLAETPEHLSWIKSCEGRFYAIGSAEGLVYEIPRSGCRRIETGLHSGNRATGGVHGIGGGRFVCLGDNGQLARFSADGGPVDSGQLDNRSATGMNINSLRKVPGETLAVGSHFISSQIFRVDLATGEFASSLNKVVTVAGQITCSVHLDGVVYLGVYGHALVLAYRPEEPFVFGHNPRLLAKVGHQQNRPMGIFQDGRLLYMVTRAGYGELGGAIAVIDPADGTCEVFRNFVPSQNPVSFFQHGDLLAGTTEVHGDQGSCAAEAEEAVIFVWNTVERRTVRTHVPWPAKNLRALALSPAGAMIGFGSGKFFLFDVGTGECSVSDWDGPEPSSGIFLDARRFLVAIPQSAEKSLVRLLDVSTGTVQTVQESVALRFFEMLEPDSVLASADGSEIVRVQVHDH